MFCIFIKWEELFNIINKLIDTNYQLYLEIALSINKELFESKSIPYSVYKYTEDNLIKKSQLYKEDNN